MIGPRSALIGNGTTPGARTMILHGGKQAGLAQLAREVAAKPVTASFGTS